MEKVGIKDEEVKWQKVNAYTCDKYKALIDELFSLIEEGKSKIRIFFRHNTNKYLYEQESKKETYTKLYYQFIKHCFGLGSAPYGTRFELVFDELPIGDTERERFKDYLCMIVNIEKTSIKEVDSKKYLPLQMLDLVLGAMCFRLNDKHKEKKPATGKRGTRTIKREQLYRHILSHICRVTGSQFNIGTSTSIKSKSEKWTAPYLHWDFVPIKSEYDSSAVKH